MKEQLITFETAKLAKEKGFVGLFPTTNYIPMYVDYEEDGNGILTEQQGEDDVRFNFYSAPTQSLLQKWLREVHKINLVPDCMWIKGGYECTGYDLNNENKKIISLTKYDKYPTYEEALEAGLQEALKLI